MKRQFDKYDGKHYLSFILISVVLWSLGMPSFAQQTQGMMGKGESCGMGAGGIVLFSGVGVSAIAALLALTYFLVKKSRA